MANCEAKIMNDEGTAEVPHGERGEIWVRGPNVMLGYWNNPKATAETLTADGWLKTGDICYIDSRGHFTVVDRRKELIKVKGNQVAPAELEAVLLDHPEVSDAAVVGVTIEGEELPRAYIVLRPGGKAKPSEIASWLSTRVARHKRLAGGVKMIDSIPKNPVSLTRHMSFMPLLWYKAEMETQSGKILRKSLRERAAREANSSSETTVKARL